MTSLLGVVTGATQHISEHTQPHPLVGVVRAETDLQLSTGQDSDILHSQRQNVRIFLKQIMYRLIQK